MCENVDGALIETDEDGTDWYVFTIGYDFEGARFDAEIRAQSWEDASERIEALVNSLLSNKADVMLLTHRSDHDATIH